MERTYWVVISVCLVIFAVDFKGNILVPFFLQFFSKKEKLKLGICILSARDNHEQRQAIRDTWLSSLGENGKTVFVVGQSCPIHPEYRVDVYECKKWNRTRRVKESYHLFSKNDNLPQLNMAPVKRLAIQVIHPVTVRKLGISEDFLTDINTSSISLTLFDGLTEDEIINVRFSHEDKGVLEKGFYYQPIQSLILPKGFMAELAIDNSDVFTSSYIRHKNLAMSHLIMNDGGALHVEGMKDDRTYLKDHELCSLLSLIFTIDNEVEIEEKQRNEADLALNWEKKQSDIDKKLMSEREDYGDILLVNTVDIYRHLPQKLLQCHQWYEKNYDVDYLMKTDDDCYVDIEQIFEKLLKFKNLNKTWWGNFRSEWLVERHGKWKERDYTASVYPTFACGSGNILSSDIHKWLVKNHNDMNHFQGEDVSMGIWLSSLAVKYVQDESLMCNKSCLKESPPLVVPELNIMELKAYWSNKLQCNNPCSCK